VSASLYLKNTFLIDSNPHLGKMMIAADGYLTDFDRRLSCNEIGQDRNLVNEPSSDGLVVGGLGGIYEDGERSPRQR
jgi:hypothetical protein